MQVSHFHKAALLASTLTLCAIACLEGYWRARGFPINYNDDKVLWAKHRKVIYQPINQSTVIIGSSRIRFGLDIPTWEELTGEDAVQLALGGTSPRLILLDLANDENFKGKLLIDVMEPLFFCQETLRNEKSAKDALAYYYSETPAQQFSAAVNFLLESKFVFLEEGKFGLNALLNDLSLGNRAGVVFRMSFPKEFNGLTIDRQSAMTPMFLSDQDLQKKKIAISINSISFKIPGMKDDRLELFLQETKTAIDKIRARGGSVVFVRPPSSHLYLETENRLFPRQAYWERLLTETHTPGIYFADNPQTAALTCPDWTHLSPDGAVLYTEQLVYTLQTENGWTFKNKININRSNSQ